MTLNKIVRNYIILEILILGLHYLFILLNMDFFTDFLQITILILSSIGLFICGYLIYFRKKQKLTKHLFMKYFFISIIGTLSPLIFFLLLLINLH
jgi:hypothetical protein